MRGTRALLFVPLLAASFAASCASTKGPDEVLAERASAAPREYAVATDTAWRLVGRTFEAAGFTDIVEHRDQQAVTARRKLSGESAASIAAAWIEPGADGKTRVAFKSMRETGSVGRSPASEEEFHARFAGLVSLEGK